MAAWAFAAAGLGAATGVATAVAYGAMVLVASLPGVVVLLAARSAVPGAHVEAEGSRSMPERPYTILSCSISLDGYLGGGTDERLVLSNEADLERVDRVRAECDAILVGAGTVRATTRGCSCATRGCARSGGPGPRRVADEGDA